MSPRNKCPLLFLHPATFPGFLSSNMVHATSSGCFPPAQMHPQASSLLPAPSCSSPLVFPGSGSFPGTPCPAPPSAKGCSSLLPQHHHPPGTSSGALHDFGTPHSLTSRRKSLFESVKAHTYTAMHNSRFRGWRGKKDPSKLFFEMLSS